jgi:ParB-like chromosome segregation protein Spo0J
MASKTNEKFHPLAEAFPLINGDEFEELVADIHKNGLLQPVIMHEGKILDGRNRWRACQRLGIPHTEKKFTGEDPAAYVWAINAVRRQLTASQKALAATKLVTAKAGENQHTPEGASVTRAEAAKLAGTSKRTVDRAKKVMVEAIPEVVAAVESGELSVTTAERISGLSEQEQMSVMATTPPAQLARVVPDGRVHKADPDALPATTTLTPEEEAEMNQQVSLGPGRGYVGAKTKLTRQLEASSAEGAKLRTKTWAENREVIPELDSEQLDAFVKDLRAEGRAIAQLIKLIGLARNPGNTEKDQEN